MYNLKGQIADVDPVQNTGNDLIGLYTRRFDFIQNFKFDPRAFIQWIRMEWASTFNIEHTVPTYLVNLAVQLRDAITSDTYGLVLDFVPFRDVVLQKDAEDDYWGADGVAAELKAVWGGDPRYEGWQGYGLTATCNGINCETMPPFSSTAPDVIDMQMHPLGFRIISKLQKATTLIKIVAQVYGYFTVASPLRYHDLNGRVIKAPSWMDYQRGRVKEFEWTTRLNLSPVAQHGAVGISILPYKEIQPLLQRSADNDLTTQSDSSPELESLHLEP